MLEFRCFGAPFLLRQNQGALNSICADTLQPHQPNCVHHYISWIFHRQSRTVRNNPLMSVRELFPTFWRIGIVLPSPGRQYSALPVRSLTVVTSRKGCGKPLLQVRIPVLAFYFRHGCVGLDAPHRRWIMKVCTIGKSSPRYKSRDGMYAHTPLSTSCNTSGPGRLNLTMM